jgi:flagellar biosynthesis/type III secretory pathway protein FliH
VSSFIPIYNTDTDNFSAELMTSAQERERVAKETAAKVNLNGEPEPTPEPTGPTPEEIAEIIAAAEARGAQAARAEMAAEKLVLQKQRADMVALIQQVEESRKADVSETRQLIGGLIMASMRRLIGEHPVLREAALREAFSQAVAGMVGDRDVVLWVAPDQESFAQELIEEREGWSVRVNPEQAGGLKINGPRGSLDASMSSALGAMESAVNIWLEERP